MTTPPSPSFNFRRLPDLPWAVENKPSDESGGGLSRYVSILRPPSNSPSGSEAGDTVPTVEERLLALIKEKHVIVHVHEGNIIAHCNDCGWTSEPLTEGVPDHRCEERHG